MWTNAGITLIWPLETNFSEFLIEICTFSFMKIHLKISSVKWRPFCFGLNVLAKSSLKIVSVTRKYPAGWLCFRWFTCAMLMCRFCVNFSEHEHSSTYQYNMVHHMYRKPRSSIIHYSRHTIISILFWIREIWLQFLMHDCWIFKHILIILTGGISCELSPCEFYMFLLMTSQHWFV